MKSKVLGYVYDSRYYKTGKDIYAAGVFDITVWERFLDGFDKIIVFASIYEVDKKEIRNLNKMNHPKVEYVNVEYIDSVKQLLKNMFFLNKVFKNNFRNIDALVIRVPGQYTNNAFRVARKMNIPIGVEVVGCAFDSYWNYGSIQGKILAPISYQWMKHVVKKADYALYVTEEFLQRRYPASSLKITNASNVNVLVKYSEELIKDKLARLKSNVLDKKIKLGLMGSFNVKYKGHVEIIKALSLVENKENITIEMIGPGNYEWVLELAKSLGLEKNVHILGKLKSGNEVINWLSSIDVYVHPSKQEGLPRSIIEAMTQVCPVLASNLAGIPELINSKYLHTPGNFKQLASQIESIAFNYGELSEMAKSNYQKSLKYDGEILSKRRKSFWNEFSKEI